MSSNQWWNPEVLKSSQKAFLDNDNLESLDTDNDFGSYKIMRIKDDINGSQILSHNDLQPSYKVRAIKKILGERKYKNLLDIGCGLGYTANELDQVFLDASITGMDISEDAILYANNKFSKCNFICEAIDPTNKDQKFKFDLITAFEFYPFTRTDSLEDHISYINHLTKDFELGNTLVIFQRWDNKNSLSVNYKLLQQHFSDLNFEAYNIPIRIIGIIFYFRKLAVILSEIIRPILHFIRKQPMGKNKLIIISKK